MSDAARIQHINMLKKTARGDQKKAIDYFSPGCFLLGTKDDAFDNIVAAQRNARNTRQLALNKIGLDEDELKEIPDVSFEGFQIDTWNNGTLDGFSKVGADGKWRSGKYAMIHLFFSSTQVYVYSYTFSVYNNDRQERTEEYFYKDSTNFSTSSETVNAYNPTCLGGVSITTASTQRFALIVPGDKFTCETQMDIERSVQAMKGKLREKKNA